MSTATSTTEPNQPPALDRDGIKGIVRAVVSIVIFSAAIFVAAGRLDWAAGWIYAVLVLGGSVCFRLVVLRKNPELINRRSKLGQGTKLWDKIFLALYLPITLAMVVVAGLDVMRFGWSTMSGWLWLPGLVAFAASTVLGTWAMVTNPHFESSVRIQTDRDHRVIDSGPYRYVRHPGYVSALLSTLATPLLLGSWWAMVPAGILAGAFVIRTALEDRMLRRELDGYAEYAHRVRARLVPLVW